MNPAYFVGEREREKESWKFCCERETNRAENFVMREWEGEPKCWDFNVIVKNCPLKIFNWKLTYLNPSNVKNTLKI